MKPAYSYLRVSSKGQLSGDGFTRQRAAILAFAKENDYEIVQEFKDGNVSGTKDGFDRKSFTELMVALKANGIRTFIVENVDRLARDFAVQEIILRDCRKHNITVLDASGTDLTVEDDNPTKKLVRSILGLIAEYDKNLIVQKLAAARMRIRSEGKRCEGAKSYQDINHTAINCIIELKKQKLSLKDIAGKLNSEGIKPMRGEKWFAMQILRIVKNYKK